MLIAERVTQAFGALLALHNVSIEVKEGEILGLIGPNGSGKSTLFNVISGVLSPTAGRVSFRGRNITGLSPDRICRRGLARTFQIPRPFRKLSLVDNVALAAYYGSQESPTPEHARKIALDTLELVGLPADPQASVAGLGAAGLKKLELARALATRPKLLLADESLGGLDASEMEQAAILGNMGDAVLDQPMAGNSSHRFPFHHHVTGDEGIQSRDHAHQRGFAGAVGAHHGDQLAPVHAERDAVERAKGAIGGGDPVQFEHGVICGALKPAGRKGWSVGPRRRGFAQIHLDHLGVPGHLGRRSLRDQLPMVEHDHAIHDPHQYAHDVLHPHDGDTHFPADAPQQLGHGVGAGEHAPVGEHELHGAQARLVRDPGEARAARLGTTGQDLERPAGERQPHEPECARAAHGALAVVDQDGGRPSYGRSSHRRLSER